MVIDKLLSRAALRGQRWVIAGLLGALYGGGVALAILLLRGWTWSAPTGAIALGLVFGITGSHALMQRSRNDFAGLLHLSITDQDAVLDASLPGGTTPADFRLAAAAYQVAGRRLERLARGYQRGLLMAAVMISVLVLVAVAGGGRWWTFGVVMALAVVVETVRLRRLRRRTAALHAAIAAPVAIH